jgi:hypothetical protein
MVTRCQNTDNQEKGFDAGFTFSTPYSVFCQLLLLGLASVSGS